MPRYILSHYSLTLVLGVHILPRVFLGVISTWTTHNQLLFIRIISRSITELMMFRLNFQRLIRGFYIYNPDIMCYNKKKRLEIHLLYLSLDKTNLLNDQLVQNKLGDHLEVVYLTL